MYKDNCIDARDGQLREKRDVIDSLEKELQVHVHVALQTCMYTHTYTHVLVDPIMG